MASKGQNSRIHIRQVVNRRHEEALDKIRTLFKKIKNWKWLKSTGAFLKRKIEENEAKSSHLNLAALITNAMVFAAYCVISPILAEYEGTQVIRYISFAAILFLVAASFWEIICLVKYKNLVCAGTWVLALFKKISACFHRWPRFCSLFSYLIGLILIVLVFLADVIALFFKKAGNFFHRHVAVSFVLAAAAVGTTAVYIVLTPQKSYYTSVVEIFGIPTGVGESLSPEEQEERAEYWKIENYPWLGYMRLTYVEPYDELDLMRQYSSLYGMRLFQPCAYMEISYAKDKDKYRNCDFATYVAARKQGFLVPWEMTYYNNSDEVVLRQTKNEMDKFEITAYSSEDAPQLFNSTLLRVPEGQTLENGVKSLQMEVVYNSDGLPRTRKLTSGIYNLYGVNGEQYTYDQHNRLSALSYLDISGNPACNKQGIMMISFEYEENGNLHSISYFSDAEGEEKTEGYYGVFCERFIYDVKGNLIERHQLDRNESLRYDENGVCIYRYGYEGNRLIGEEFLGFDRSSTINHRFRSRSVAFQVNTISEEREIHISFDTYGATGALAETGGVQEMNKTLRRKIAFSDQTARLEVRGEIVEKTQGFGNNEEESEDIPRSYESVHYTFDNEKHISEVSYYGNDDNLVVGEEGYAVKRIRYYNGGRTMTESYFDVNGTPCLIKGGYASVKRTYDVGSNRDIKCVEYLDVDENLTFNREQGYAYVNYRYFDMDRKVMVRKEYCAPDGTLVRISGKGYAAVEEFYDERGFLVQEIYYDEANHLGFRSDYKVAQILYEYADDGNLISECYKDEKGNLINRSDTGYAMVFQEYDAGQLKRRYYENRTLSSVLDRTTGVADIEYIYDKGKKVEERYFDTAGEPVLRWDTGFARQVFEYNDRGILRAQYFYGEDDQLILRKDTGYAIVKYQHDKLGQREASYFYGTNGQLIISTEYHCAGFKYGYDANGNKVYVGYIGLDGNLMVRRDLGYAQIEYQYDEYGRKETITYKDAAGNPTRNKDGGYTHCVNRYDINGNWMEGWYYDEQWHEVLKKDDGYAGIKNEYDEYGQRKCEYYYGTGGYQDPVISTSRHCAEYEFDYDERGRMTDVRYYGPEGELMVRRDLGYAQVHYEYDDAGNIRSVSYLDTEGDAAISKVEGYAFCEVFYDRRGNWVEEKYYDEKSIPVNRKSVGCAVIKNEYDEYCQRIRERYYEGDGETPVISSVYHCMGFDFEYDGRGNKTAEKYIDLDGSLMVRRDLGYAQVKYEYDDVRRKISESYFDVEGKKVLNKEGGYASYRNSYNERGEVVEIRFFDERGKLVIRSDLGYAIAKNKYDEYGQWVAQQYYGAGEELSSIFSTKYKCAGYLFEYDERGNVKLTQYVDLEGKLMIQRDLGYAQKSYEYDSVDNIIRTAYLDTEGNPVVCKKGGYASICDKYDARGNWIKEEYFDARGIPMLRRDTGCAGVINEYDEYGQRIAEYYYGVEGKSKPIISAEYRCAGIEYEYDERGNQVALRYIDREGELMAPGNLGYAQVYYEYDNAGNKITISYRDVNENPATCKEGGYATCKSKYDAHGNMLKEEYFDSQDVPVLREDTGYAEVTNVYDEYCLKIAEYYYGIGDDPELIVCTDNHCAGCRYEYDERGNQTEIMYVGLDGELTVSENLGYAGVYREYNNRGDEIQTIYFDEERHWENWKEGGYASCVSKYDRNGNWLEDRYYDKWGNLVRRKDTGYAVVKNEYDEISQRTSQYFYDCDEKSLIISTEYSCAGFQFEYDGQGNRTTVKYFGSDGKPMAHEKWGYAEVNYEYDNMGNCTLMAFSDVNGEPVLRKEGDYASCRSSYDRNRKLIEEKYFDAQGNLAILKDEGFAVIRNEYDRHGQWIGQYYYDNSEEPKLVISKKYHCAGFEYEYDEQGYWISEKYIGQNGEAMIRKDYGYAVLHRTYDQRGYLITEEYCDEKEMPVNGNDGYARTEYEYDSLGNLKDKIHCYYLNGEWEKSDEYQMN